jgi:WD40 repeat protein
MSSPSIAQDSVSFAFDAYVTAAIFDAGGVAAFALGDGTVRLAAPAGVLTVEAHDGAILCAAQHPSGRGVVTGGDDGAVVWTRLEGDELAATRLARQQGRWIDAIAASPASGLIAYACGKSAAVLDAADAGFARTFAHERTVAGLAFDPKGRRLAAASYGGVSLWWAKIADQKPSILKWPGGHGALAWSPDGKFLISSLQENQLHGWRLSDAKDMRMGGYPAKVKAMAFTDNGAILATSGAGGAVVWPFTGPTGPMGKEAAEIGLSPSGAKTTCVAAAPARPVMAAGFDDGTLWAANLKTGKLEKLKSDKGPAITAVAVAADARAVAFGDEAGGAWVMRLRDF